MPQGLNADHRSNRLLAALEPEDFACLEPHLELVNLTHKQVLFDMGDAVSHAYFPHNAIVSLVNVMEDGATVEVGVFGCEGVLGLLSAMASWKACGRCIVQMSGAASRIAFERMKEVQNARPKLRQLILNYGEALLGQTFQTVACNAIHPVEARCSRWILALHDRSDQDTLPLTHEFLAEMLGVQRSTVSVVTRTLQTAGLIQQSRGSITFTDRMGLEDAACECYGRIRSLYRGLLPGTYPYT